MAHGLQKVAGLFGGKGIGGTAEHFEMLGVPFPLLVAILVGCIETFYGLSFALGTFTPIAGFLLCCVMAGAIILVHGPNGFWASQQGFEYNMVLAIVSLCVALIGPGNLTIKLMYKKRK